MDAEDLLFVLYTSGSTGKPKGVLHTTGGYMVYAATTSKYIFDLQDGDVYFCTADCGWITGVSRFVPTWRMVTLSLLVSGMPWPVWWLRPRVAQLIAEIRAVPQDILTSRMGRCSTVLRS